MNIQLNTFQKKYDIDKIEKVCNHIYKHVQIIKNPETSECYRVETYCKKDGSPFQYIKDGFRCDMV
mgnify:CR=1 FL=1